MDYIKLLSSVQSRHSQIITCLATLKLLHTKLLHSYPNTKQRSDPRAGNMYGISAAAGLCDCNFSWLDATPLKMNDIAIEVGILILTFIFKPNIKE